MQALLLQLLAPDPKLLLHLHQPGLVFLFGLGHLLAGLEQQLLTLLARLVAQLGHLALCLLAHRLGADQLLPLLTRLADHLIGLLAGLVDEVFFLTNQLLGLGQLAGQGFPNRIHHLDGVLLVDQAPTTEGDPAAIQHDLLQLVELIQHGFDLGLSHHVKLADPD